MKVKSTKRALLASLLSLVICISMLVGSTFAWFTDSVTSANNIIKSGNLDVTLEWMDGKVAPADPDDAAWKDASTDAIFNYNLWEPGYTTVRHIKIGNEGSLALKYKVVIEANGTVSDLTDVIDVYYFDPAQQIADRTALAGVTPMGTLTTVLGNMSTTAQGELAANTDDIITIALKMKETAGNEYMNKQVGDSFAIKVFATQLAAESDSFGNDYDVFADYDGEISTPVALVDALKKGGTYKLVGDVTVPAGVLPVVPEGVTVVLDLAGNDLSAENVETEYALNNLGKLTIWDSTSIASTYSLRSTPAATINARGIYNGYDKDGNYVSDAEITVLNGTINAKGTNGGAAIFNYGKVTIESGTFTSAGGYALNNQPGAEMIIKNASVTGGVYNCGDLTIENSTVYQHISGRHAVYNWSANLVINSGSFDSTSGNELILADGQGASVTINGGTFDKTAKSWLFGAATGKNITFDIYGGTFNGYVNMPEGTVDTVRPYGDPIVIYGGSFNFDPTTWVADGYSVIDNGDGTWTVIEGIIYNSATMGGLYEYLPTLSSGDVLILTSGTYNMSGTLSVPAGVTLKGAEGAEVVFHQNSAQQDDIFNCAGDVVFENIIFESNRKGYAITYKNQDHVTDGDITVIGCKFKGIATEKNYGIYKNLNGNLTVKDCTFDNYNNALCGINNGNGSTTTITGCTFTNINDEAIGYVISGMPADFEAEVIANNVGLTAENVKGW